MTVLPAKYNAPPHSKGPYSAIVYIDGSQVVAEDTNGKVIASGVAGTDDATVVQTAMNTADADKILHIACDLTLGSVITRASGIKIFGNGSTITIPTALLGLEPLQFSGSVIATATLPRDATAGDFTVTVANASGVNKGDLLQLYDNTQFNPIDYPRILTGEIHKIMSISGNVLTLDAPLHNSYVVTQSATSVLIHPIRVEISGLTFVAPDSTADYRAIYCLYCVPYIHDCVLHEIGHQAINLIECYESLIKDNIIYNCLGSEDGYGVVIVSSTKTIIENCRISNCRHCVAIGADGTHIGQSWDTIIRNCHIQGSNLAQALDAHPTVEDISVIGCNIYVKSGYYGLQSSGRRTIFQDNHVYGQPGGSARGVRIVNSLTNRITVIKNNTFENAAICEVTSAIASGHQLLDIQGNSCENALIGITTGSTAGMYARIRIIGNEIYNTDSSEPGMLVCGANVSCEILNNIIHTVGQYGLYVSNTCVYTTIRGNSIINSNTSAGNNAGIELYGSYNIVEGNLVKGLAANNQYYAIREVGSDYNIIRRNILEDTWTNSILVTGTHDTIDHNKCYSSHGSMYVTESSGSSAGTGSEQTIAHGLVAAPTKLTITPLSTDGLCSKMWADATNIYVTFTPNKNYNWSAEI